MANGEYRIFISAVTSEFGRARDGIADDLNARGIQVKVQRNFRQEADTDTTLNKIHNYIKDCDAVICVVGKRSGDCPPPAASDRFADILRDFGFASASYTQWEFFFARYYHKRLSIHIASDDYVPDKSSPTGEDDSDLQRAFVRYIEEQGLDRDSFSNVDQLRVAVLVQIWPKRKLNIPVKLPYPTIDGLFEGRSAFIRQLEESLTRARVALHGLPGVGKTRAAVEYAWEHQREYSALLFVMADTAETLRRDLAALTGPLGLPERDSTDEDLKMFVVLNWLRRNPFWLLIIDSVNSEYTLEETTGLMGQMTGGHLLITSQLRNFPPHIEPLEVKLLDRQASTRFLVERTKRGRRPRDDDKNKAYQLAERLGDLPLAMEQAGAIIAEKRWTFSDYLERWDKLLYWCKPGVTQYPYALAVTFQLSASRLSNNASDLLQRLAWFSPEPIPEDVLDAQPPHAGDKELSDSLDELSSLSLVTRRPENSVFSVHPLVQKVTRRNFAGRNRQSLEEAVRWMDAVFTGDPSDVNTWPRLDPLWPHALAIATHAQRNQIASATRLTTALSLLLTTKSRYAQREIELGFSPPRAWLLRITQLKFRHTKFKNALKPLEELTNLEELTLTGIYVGDAAPLAKWANLQRLDLGRTEVISIAPLSRLTALRRLDLSRTKVSDLGPIRELTNLESLSLGHTLVTDTSPIEALVKLRDLDLTDTPLKNITKLARLSNLTRLGLGGTRIRDISEIQELANLRRLDLSDTNVTDLKPLAKLTNLEELRLNGAKVRELGVLANLTKLKHLDLSGTKVREISALSKLVNLAVLSLGGCAVTEVAGLARLLNLQALNLGCTRITDVKALEGLVNLLSLDLRGTRVREVWPITRMIDLRNVDLSHTNVTDVAALAALPYLENLHLEGTRATLAPTERLKIFQEFETARTHHLAGMA